MRKVGPGTGGGAASPEEGKGEVMNVRAEAIRGQSPLHHALTAIANVLSHPYFFIGEVVLHGGWIVLNTVPLPGVQPWDPYPFSLLTGLASVQALFIGLLILMFAQREADIAELREEVDLQVVLHSERETSKVLRMLAELHEALGVRSKENDRELEVMSQPLDPQRLKRSTEDDIEAAEEE